MKRLVLLSVWFGELPCYFPIFVHSCRALAEIDFLLLHDRPADMVTKSENLRLKLLSREDFTERCRRKLDLTPSLPNGYKLTDLKPAFGDLFEDLMEGYDYWGVCDIDQILSPTLVPFVSAAMEEGSELINTHSQFLHGPLMIFQNVPKLRSFYRRSRDWEKAFLDPKHRAFDECGEKYKGIGKLLGAPDGCTDVGRTFLELSYRELLEIEDFECMTSVALREYQAGRLKLFTQTTTRDFLRPGEWVEYRENRVWDNEGKSWHAYHWVNDKVRRKFHYPNWDEIPEAYYVTQYGFFDSSRPVWNFVLWPIRFFRALGLLICDRVRHALGWLSHLLGCGPRPEDFV